MSSELAEYLYLIYRVPYSGVSIVIGLDEYGDYECPYCGQAYPIVREIQKQLAHHLRFVFRNFPLTQVHPPAQQAAEAAEAAGGKKIFANA